MTRLPPELIFDLVKGDEVLAAHKLEIEGFPQDEVSPFEQFRFRQEHAPTLFLGAFISPSTSDSRRTMIGFACATRSMQPTYTAASMKGHDPKGSSVCIHNVVVSNAYRGRGIARALVELIIVGVRKDGLTNRALLICHDNIRPLYSKVGFECVGPSPIVLGRQQWLEMCLPLNHSFNNGDTTAQKANGVASPPLDFSNPSYKSTQRPPDNLEVLQRQNSSRTTSSARLPSSIAGGHNDVTVDSNGKTTNKHDIVCPRSSCTSTILKANLGHLAAKELPELEAKGSAPPSAMLTDLPPAGTVISCWLIRGSMSFENIGFSRDIGSNGVGGKLKLLSCVECDIGPLGWYTEGGNESWLICSRVGRNA